MPSSFQFSPAPFERPGDAFSTTSTSGTGVELVRFAEGNLLFGVTSAFGSAQVKIMDLADPLNPTVRSQIYAHRSEFAVDHDNDVLVSFNNFQNYTIWSLADMSNPQKLYDGGLGIDETVSTQQPAAGHGFMVLVGDDNLYLFDVSDPANPQKLDSHYDHYDSAWMEYPHVYARGVFELDTFDISGGMLSEQGGAYARGGFGAFGEGFFILYNHFSHPETAVIYDTADLSAPIEASSAALGSGNVAAAVGAQGTQAFALWGNFGGYAELIQLDVSDPDEPVEIARHAVPGNQPRGNIAVHDGHLYWGDVNKDQLYVASLASVDAAYQTSQSVRTGQLATDRLRVRGSAEVGGPLEASGNLYTRGGVTRRRRGVATDADVRGIDFYVGVTDTSAARTLTLTSPAARNREHIIKDESGAASTNAITIATVGAQTIDGAATASISTDYGSVHLISDGDNWYTV